MAQSAHMTPFVHMFYFQEGGVEPFSYYFAHTLVKRPNRKCRGLVFAAHTDKIDNL